MPIGDLLAQISGDPADRTSTPLATRPSGTLKRKADDEARNNPAKTPRIGPNDTNGSTSTSRPTDKAASTPYKGTAMNRPTATPRITNSSAVRSTAPAARTSNGTNGTRQPLSTGKKASGPHSSTTTSVTTPAKPAAPPKKGSYAEILARAKMAQSTMGQVGRIQHKQTEKGAIKKERTEPPSAAKRPSNQLPGSVGPRFQGTARPANGTSRPTPNSGLQRRATDPPSTSRDARNGSVRNGAHDRSGAKRGASAAAEPEKKIKKAAVATTGYTGTARPRPGVTASKSKKPPAPGGALLNPRGAGRHGGSARRSRLEEEEDEDMDDFIDYDDEEEEEVGGPRYRYDSGSESDMEAGMDDIYKEETRAARQARLEDMEQEKLEKRLKAEKEERKRRFYEGQNSRR